MMLGALLDALPGALRPHCVLGCSELCTYGRTDVLTNEELSTHPTKTKSLSASRARVRRFPSTRCWDRTAFGEELV